MLVSTFHHATEAHVLQAVDAALAAKKAWAAMPYEARISVFLKAARLLATTYRHEALAAAMLGQSKTAFQADIDVTAETIDFWRFNAYYATQIFEEQPERHNSGIWNRLDMRPLDGFIMAIAPFNFTAIAANLASAPAIMGNTVLLKPADTNVLATYVVVKVLREAGLPPGVINFLPGGHSVFKAALHHKALGGLHFTGSTKAFIGLSKDIAMRLEDYDAFPRLVGETGGKNFHFIHSSMLLDETDMNSVVNKTVRGAFEFQGQKCSATSRVYYPKQFEEAFLAKMKRAAGLLKVGDAADLANYLGAVIDQASYDRLVDAMRRASEDSHVELIAGGTADDSVGYFVRPTVYKTTSPECFLLHDEFFGPIVTCTPYDDEAPLEKVCAEIEAASPYALTGSIFVKDAGVQAKLEALLRFAAGNLYINDKSTGAVVGQQPFGGSKKSGTNDKSGSKASLYRWVSARSIKENYRWPLRTCMYRHQMDPV